jgi:hypothetical protein
VKLVIIIGSGAVGKMTVGQELMKITDLRLFHNHMSIEPVIEIFGSFRKSGVAVRRFREVIFEEFVKSDNYGMIFTFMLSFDEPSDWEYLDSLVNVFRCNGADIYYVELFAPQEVRLKRNKTENRLKNKPSKNNVEFSTNLILDEDANHRLVSHDGEIKFENYIKIDNSELSPETVAKMIREKFAL